MEFISRIFFHRFFSTSIPGFFARNTYKQNTLQVENIMLEKYPGILVFTLPKTNSLAPEKLPSQKETIVFQPSIFRCYVSFREGNHTSFPLIKNLNFIRKRVAPSFRPTSKSRQFAKCLKLQMWSKNTCA